MNYKINLPKKRYIFIGIFLFVLFFFNLVDAQKLPEENLIKISEALENESFAKSLINDENFVGIKILDDKPFVRVTVFLKDDSGIEVAGTKEEKRELTDQKISWFSQEIDKLLRIIPETEIQEVDKTPEGFHALLSEDALQTLIDNKNILKISWEQYKPKLILEESAPLINADDAWMLGYTGEGVSVCIIDTGIDKNNNFLPAPVEEQCYCYDNCCPGGLSGINNATDEDGHGTENLQY